MEANWKWWKKNTFYRYNNNPFLKRMEEEEYRGGKIEEWNDKEDEKD